MIEPSNKAKQQMGRRPTESQETFCKYCKVEHGHPKNLKLHVFTNHWNSNRQVMYRREEEFLRFRKTQT